MTLLVIGISHHSAPLELLDRVVLAPRAVEALRDDLAASRFVAEVMVLSTCNRLEVIAEIDRFHGAVGDVSARLSKHSGIDRSELAEHVLVHFDQKAISHVFRVAAGIESLVVGERQIVGQVRAALRDAQEAGTAGRALNAVGQRALRAAKRVHAETGIDRHGASIVSVGLDLAAAELGGLRGKSAVVVGAGAMSSLAMKRLAASHVEKTVVANRTATSAQQLASAHAAAAVAMADLPAAMREADVVVSATGSADVVIAEDDVAEALSGRAPGRGPLVVVDLAVPHDTAPAIAALAGAIRIDLARLGEAPGSKAARTDVDAACAIVADEVRLFLSEQSAQRVEPVLVSLRAKADAVMEAELDRLMAKLPGLSDQEIAAIERSWRRAVSALLHTPTVRMKQFAAASGGERYAEAIHALFDLDPHAMAALIGPIADLDPEIGEGSWTL